ncbi:MAG: hypothetical protein WCI51_01000 [Lentisphaerota bacterium]
MKGRINEGGILAVRRDSRGEMAMICPFRNVMTPCCNWCPHLDTDNPDLIRLTCGGTDVAIEVIKTETEVNQE